MDRAQHVANPPILRAAKVGPVCVLRKNRAKWALKGRGHARSGHNARCFATLTGSLHIAFFTRRSGWYQQWAGE
jgi:hypothetical protein